MQTPGCGSLKMAFIFPHHPAGIRMATERPGERRGWEISAFRLERPGLISLSMAWRVMYHSGTHSYHTVQRLTLGVTSKHWLRLNPTLTHKCSQCMASKRQRPPKCLSTEKKINKMHFKHKRRCHWIPKTQAISCTLGHG